MSELGTHVAVARARAGVPPATSLPTIADVRAVLVEVPDPELPVLSVVDLGIIHRVEVDAAGIRVVILPTFVGCPALDVIRGSIADRLAQPSGCPSPSTRRSRCPGPPTASRLRGSAPSLPSASPRHPSPPTCAARSVHPNGSSWTARSGRRNAGPCSTAAPAASRSRRSSRSEPRVDAVTLGRR